MDSLHWLLKEPIIHKAHLDISAIDYTVPGLNKILCSARTTTLGLMRLGLFFQTQSRYLLI